MILRKQFCDDFINMLLKSRRWDKSIEEINELIPILACRNLERVKAECKNRLCK